MVNKRSYSARIREQIMADEDGDGYLVLVSMTHPDLEQTIRVVSDVFDCRYMPQGDTQLRTFQAVPFAISLVTDSDGMPSAKLNIPNIDRRVSLAIEALESEPTVEITVLSRQDFNTEVDPSVPLPGTPEIVYNAKMLKLTNVDVTQLTITGTLSSWRFRNEPWPARYTSKAAFPGLYR